MALTGLPRSAILSPIFPLFQVLKIMKMELAASGLSEEDILHKAQMLMKAFGREDTASTAEFSLISAQKNAALKQCNVTPKDFSTVRTTFASNQIT